MIEKGDSIFYFWVLISNPAFSIYQSSSPEAEAKTGMQRQVRAPERVPSCGVIGVLLLSNLDRICSSWNDMSVNVAMPMVSEALRSYSAKLV